MTDLQTELAALITDALYNSTGDDLDDAQFIAERLASAFQQVGWRHLAPQGEIHTIHQWQCPSDVEPVYRFARPTPKRMNNER